MLMRVPNCFINGYLYKYIIHTVVFWVFKLTVRFSIQHVFKISRDNLEPDTHLTFDHVPTWDEERGIYPSKQTPLKIFGQEVYIFMYTHLRTRKHIF